MAITFTTQTAKKTSVLIDALRILAWEEYKVTNKEALKDVEDGGYEVFSEEWKAEEIHNFSYWELLDFIKALEYTPKDLLNYRSDYYAKEKSSSYSSQGNQKPSKSNGNGNGNGYEDESAVF
jgi:hypothetical protein